MPGFFNKKKQNRLSARPDPKVRAERLLQEYDRIFTGFRNHPHISVKEVFGTPPEKYHILFRVDGLAQTGMSIEAKNEHVVEITLTPDYPSVQPVCKPITSIYHPNITAETIDLRLIFTAQATLAELIVGIGQMIVFQKYSTDDAINEGAGQWVVRNTSMLPLSTVDLQVAPSQDAPDTVPAIEPAVNNAIREAATPSAIKANKTENIVVEDLGEETTPSPVAVSIPAVQKPDDLDKKTIRISKRDLRCHTCGHKNGKAANYCSSCGQKLAWERPGVKKAKTFFVVSMITVPIIVITAGFFAVLLHWDRVISSGIFPNQPPVSAQEKISREAPAPEKETALEVKPRDTLKPNAEEPRPLHHADIRAPRKSDRTAVSRKKSNNAFVKPSPSIHMPENPAQEAPAARGAVSHQSSERQMTEKINNGLRLAKLYAGIGSYDDAIAQFLDVLMLDPKNQEAREGLVKVHETKKAALGK
jgi:ubiquitin-protein ligase